jgi:hypothetical protein
MMIEIAQPRVAKPDRHHTVAGFPLHEASRRARRAITTNWRGSCLVFHSVLPLLAAIGARKRVWCASQSCPSHSMTIFLLYERHAFWTWVVSERFSKSR